MLLNVIISQIIALLLLAFKSWGWNFSDINCDWHLYQHYDQKLCTPVLGVDSCPTRFDCKQLVPEDMFVCRYKGVSYKEGQQIPLPCHECFCIRGRHMAYIDCMSAQCYWQEAVQEPCRLIYQPERCCPEKVCSTKEHECKYKGKSYKFGEIIKIKPCRDCFCNSKWDGPGEPDCRDSECRLDLYKKQIQANCLVIYKKNQCCPVDIYCSSIKNCQEQKKNSQKTHYCIYKGERFPFGSTISINEGRHIGTQCHCKIPPDFTCLQD